MSGSMSARSPKTATNRGNGCWTEARCTRVELERGSVAEVLLAMIEFSWWRFPGTLQSLPGQSEMA